AKKIFLSCDSGGNRGNFGGKNPIDLGCFTDRRPEAETGLIRDHGRLACAVSAEYPVENRVPLIPGKIDVDVRRVFAAWIEEPLEEQMMFERIDMGDPKAIGDDRCGD